MTAVVKFVGGVIAGVVGIVTAQPWLTKIGIGFALSGGAEVISAAPETPKTAAIEESGQNLSLTTNPNAPRYIAFGRCATAGNLIYHEGTGAKNKDLWMVTVICGHEITAIKEIRWAGEVQTIASGGSAKSGKWRHWNKLGTSGQTAFSALVAASASKWTNNHKLRGLTCALNKFEYDPDTFRNGLEEIVYVIEGIKLYDPRKDSTNGGNGVHRVHNRATYEFSSNPAVVTLNYLLGFYENGKELFGFFSHQNSIDFPNFIAAANLCDEAVPLKVGGTEKRYTCNGWIDTTQNHKKNLQKIASCMAGQLIYQGGKWRLFPAAARIINPTPRTADHFVGGINYKPKKSIKDKINTISAQHVDPKTFLMVATPTLTSNFYIAQDGGQELTASVNWPMTTSASEAQRLNKIYLGKQRMERQVRTTLNSSGLLDQAGDNILVDYPSYNLNMQQMQITSWALRFPVIDGVPTLRVQQTLLEEDQNIYLWAAAVDEKAVPLPATVNHPDKELLDYAALGGAKPPVNADATNYTDPRIRNNKTENYVTRIASPEGGSFNSNIDAKVGAIKITLPQSWTDSMVDFFVDVFHYNNPERSFSLMVGGYTDLISQLWTNERVRITGSIASNNRVRFGHDGAKCCIVIGDVTDVSSYPKISIRDVMIGHNNIAVAGWDDDWNVEYITSVSGIVFTGDLSDNLIDSGRANKVEWGGVDGGNKPADNATDNSNVLTADGLIKETTRYHSGLVSHRLSHGKSIVYAVDGEAITFLQAWDKVPTVTAVGGGLSYSAVIGASKDQVFVFTPLNLTKIGFTVSAKIRSVVTSPVDYTETNGITTGNSFGPDIQIPKDSSSLAAYNDAYEFTFDITILNIAPIGTDGFMRVLFWIYKAGSWVEYSEEIYQGFSDGGATTTYLNLRKLITVNGVSGAGNKFGISIKKPFGELVAGGIITLRSVKYQAGGSFDEQTATPQNAPKIRIMIEGA
jgi:hypothetical protein